MVNHLVYQSHFTHPHKILFSYLIQKLINTMKNVYELAIVVNDVGIVTAEWLNVEHNIKSSLVVGVEYRVGTLSGGEETEKGNFCLE